MKQTRRFRQTLPLLALLAGPAVAMAQGAATDGDASAGVDEARQLLQAGREEIVRDDLRLTGDEAAAFWPIYARYQDDLQPIRNRYAELLAKYLELYRAGAVSEKFANQMVDQYLDIQADILSVKKKYLRQFRKALSARKATRFYQLENKMEAELQGQLAQIVPLIDPV